MLDNWWLNWQIDYLLVLQTYRDTSGHIFDNFFLTITQLGDISIPVVIASAIYWCINKNIGIYIFFNILFGVMINTLIKMTACIYRPWILSSKIHPLAQATQAAWGYSFPSGHTSNITALFGSCAIKFWNKTFLRYLFITIIFLVMFSRNYLGVHTPQDIIVSFLLVLGILALSEKLIKWEKGVDVWNKVENNRNRDIFLVAVIYTIATLLLVYISLKPYPIDYVNGKLLYDPAATIIKNIEYFGTIYGFFLGWLFEKRLINFTTDKISFGKKLVRLILGFTLLVLLMTFVKPLCLTPITSFIFYFGIGLYISAIFPSIVKIFKI